MRRLSRREYQLSLQDLLALPDAPDLQGIPQDTEWDGFSVFSELQTSRRSTCERTSINRNSSRPQ
jgi:hypothetical protein